MSADGLTIITPTADRPLALGLCRRWLARQTLLESALPVQWIVADGGESRAVIEPAVRGDGRELPVEHVPVEPADDPAQSFCRNLLAALERARYSRIAFVEDDDWYAPDYLQWLVDRLDAGRDPIAGEARARYYNLGSRRYHVHKNRLHASLCQTGLRSKLVPWVRQYLLDHPTDRLLDMRIWRHCGNPRRALAPRSERCVGIKGLPGKRGLGTGHRMGERRPSDADGSVLRSWIGAEDAAVYFGLALNTEGTTCL